MIPGGKLQKNLRLVEEEQVPDHTLHDHCVLLVSCACCERLHEPRNALDSNPICPACADKLPAAREVEHSTTSPFRA
jgi:hypothetical protein